MLVSLSAAGAAGLHPSILNVQVKGLAYIVFAGLVSSFGYIGATEGFDLRIVGTIIVLLGVEVVLYQLYVRQLRKYA